MTKLASLPALALLLPVLAVGCGAEDDGPADGGDAGPGRYALTRLIELPGCENAGEVVAEGDEAWVSCAGDLSRLFTGEPFDGEGVLARVDLSDGHVSLVELGGAPGAIALGSDRVYVGDLMDGRIFVADRHGGGVVRGAADALALCPGDYVGGISATTDGFLAVCFSADAAIRVSGTDASLAESDRATVGDGPVAIDAWGVDRWVTVDSLGGTASSLSSLSASELTAEPARWTVGEGPNDVVVQGDTALVVNSVSNTLQTLDLLTGESLGEVFIGDGTSPYNVAALGPLAFVSLQQADAVAVVDTARGAVVQTIAMPEGEALSAGERVGTAGPQGVAVAGERVLVSLTNLATVEADPFPLLVPAGSGFLAVLEVSE